MTDDRGYDWDNRWGVGGELSQKAGYYHYWGGAPEAPPNLNSRI